MNREIKFRAWHTKRNEMYNVHGWHSEYVFKDTLDGVGCDGNPDYLKDVILLQYTGLTDRNGVEIFEGDILAAEFIVPNGNFEPIVLKSRGIVNFVNCCWVLTDLEDSDDGVLCAFSSLEVIGNIHQKTDLL